MRIYSAFWPLFGRCLKEEGKEDDDDDDDDDDDGDDDDDDANNALFQPVPTFVGESESEEMLRFVFTLIARAVTRKEIVILKTFATSN